MIFLCFFAARPFFQLKPKVKWLREAELKHGRVCGWTSNDAAEKIDPSP